MIKFISPVTCLSNYEMTEIVLCGFIIIIQRAFFPLSSVVYTRSSSPDHVSGLTMFRVVQRACTDLELLS